MVEDIVLLLAAGFGLGWLPWAPGTFGSLLGIPLAWWLLGHNLMKQILSIVLLLIVGVPLCYWASEWLGDVDPSQIVADEFLAFPLVTLGLVAARTPWVMGAAFALYRLFDTTKPPPIGHIEAIGELAVVLDDVLAALFAWVILFVGLALWRRHHLA